MTRENVEEIAKTVLDMLEDYISSVSIVAGNRIVHVLYVTICFLCLSIILEFTNNPAFISIQEALTATVLTLILCCINFVNKASINKVKSLLFDKKRREVIKDEKD